ncbi:hypothetical protein [Virgisporangium aliadipatigenens]|uniref:hypothetical protein n=1 Tax=Virgisporangium aliadipatigenens TaxID=741659 RepID=UPI0019421063|nr:hypothetical protein [Virgisporangium aliadipatigenens]
MHRTHAPVVLDVGPVMHIEDLRAWKVAALVARAEHRDLIDVAAFLATNTPDELLALARRVDPGMEADDITAVGRRVDEVPTARFAEYGLDAEAVTELRRRFAAWPAGWRRTT